MDDNRRVIISGHAIAPQGTVLYETKKLITVVLELDWESGTILDAETTFMTALCNDFFNSLIVNKKLPDQFEQIRDQIQRDMHVDSKKALIKALSVVNERFQLLKINEFAQLKKKLHM